MVDNVNEANPFAASSLTAEELRTDSPLAEFQGQFGGFRRRTFWALLIGAGILFNAAIGAVVWNVANQETAAIVVIILQVTHICFLLFTVTRRLVNLGTSPWWAIGIFVPILNLLIVVRCLICPEGYAVHKRYDLAAKIALFFVLALFVLAVSVLFMI